MRVIDVRSDSLPLILIVVPVLALPDCLRLGVLCLVPRARSGYVLDHRQYHWQAADHLDAYAVHRPSSVASPFTLDDRSPSHDWYDRVTNAQDRVRNEQRRLLVGRRARRVRARLTSEATSVEPFMDVGER